jgi:hypothetical protein
VKITNKYIYDSISDFFSSFFVVCVEKITDKTRRRRRRHKEESVRKKRQIHTFIIIMSFSFKKKEEREKFTHTSTFSCLTERSFCFVHTTTETHMNSSFSVFVSQ